MGKMQVAVAGAVSAAVALGVAELVAAFLGGISLIVAIGNAIVDLTPGPVVTTAIEALGTRDKPTLLISVCVIAIALGAVFGPIAARQFAVAVALFGAFGLVGFGVALGDPSVAAGSAGLVALSAVVSGLLTFRWLTRLPSNRPAPLEMPGRGVANRRQFFTFAAAAAGGAVLAGVSSRLVPGAGVDVEAQRRALVLPIPGNAVTSTSVGLEVSELTPLVVPNDRFYRIDTALVVPRVNAETWRLRVTGMVDRPYELTLAELLSMPVIEESVTLSCVSNEVGGDLVGNALWRGIPLTTVLERAGVQRGATQIVGRSVDGFTTGFPTAVALDGRASMVAVGMNGVVLPADHGFPARLVIPGLYGYVSATKWLTEIELTTLEAFDAYWIPRGWAKEAPIKTQSRIDVPRNGATVRAGTTPIAGVAWGGIRSIGRVEVRIRPRGDSSPGQWVQARLSEALSTSSWRQWVVEWEAEPGQFVVDVRATDGENQTQTDRRQPPEPDGATGWHNISFRVV
jgi:DMSO/TMAO reductase YedYZ molybdopterin-dependent catalytic subunit